MALNGGQARDAADIPAAPPSFRTVQIELLDTLPAESPAARASRGDLRRINRLLGNTRWFRRTLRAERRSGEPVLELGAGTGELGEALRPGIPKIAGLDLCGRPAPWPSDADWFTTDVQAFAGWAAYPVILGNLFFHHFDTAALVSLGRSLGAHARVIVASEPLRSRRTKTLFALLCPLIRAHRVTRHDGRVSIAAGFRRDELPQLLRLDLAHWTWRTQETWLGACRMVATRRP